MPLQFIPSKISEIFKNYRSTFFYKAFNAPCLKANRERQMFEKHTGMFHLSIAAN